MPASVGTRKFMEITIDLRREGESLFDLLKAVIRDWKNSPWQHERERAAYAELLYQRCLKGYSHLLEEAKERAENGFNLETDRHLVREMEEKLTYWQRKLEEVSRGGKVAAGCGM